MIVRIRCNVNNLISHEHYLNDNVLILFRVLVSLRRKIHTLSLISVGIRELYVEPDSCETDLKNPQNPLINSMDILSFSSVCLVNL